MDRYYQSIAPEYSRHRQVHAVILRNLISIGKLGAASRVLDGGCATGNYLLALAEAVGCECWGIDTPAAMLAEARRRLSVSSLQLMSDTEFVARIERLQRDLSAAPIPYTWRCLLLCGAKTGAIEAATVS